VRISEQGGLDAGVPCIGIRLDWPDPAAHRQRLRNRSAIWPSRGKRRQRCRAAAMPTILLRCMHELGLAEEFDT